MKRLSHARALSLSLLLVVLGGCEARKPDTRATVVGTAEPAAVQPGKLVTGLSGIEGFWLVERFGNFEPSWQNDVPWRRAYVQIGQQGLSYSIGCNQSGNPAALGKDGILRDTGDGGRLQTLMGCPPDWEDRDAQFFAYFASAPKVRELGKGRLFLKGAEGELVLVRPETWRLANIPDFSDIEGRWVPRMAAHFEGWGFEGFGIGEKPGIITIERGRVTWSECPAAPIAIRWTGNGRLERASQQSGSCGGGSTDNGKSQVMAILSADPAVIRTGFANLSLVAGDGEKGLRLDLQSERSFLDPPAPPPLPAGTRPPPPPAPPPLPPASE